MWDLSSPIRDWTHVPCIGRWILYHWPTREVWGPQLLHYDSGSSKEHTFPILALDGEYFWKHCRSHKKEKIPWNPTPQKKTCKQMWAGSSVTEEWWQPDTGVIRVGAGKSLKMVQPSEHPGRQGCPEAMFLWQHGCGVPKLVQRQGMQVVVG